MTSRKVRESNFELLRISAMLMIVVHHYYANGNMAANIGMSVINKGITLTLGQGGKLAVNILILISGYFCINSKCNPKHLIKIELETIFYSLGIFLIACLTGVEQFKFSYLIKNGAPTIFIRYWFMSLYILLFLLVPYINQMLLLLDQKKHRNFTFLLVTMMYLIPTLNKLAFRKFSDEFSDSMWSSFLWMITIYVIGTYLGRFYKEKAGLKWKLIELATFIGAYAIGIVAEMLVDLRLGNADVSNFVYAFFFSEQSIFLLMSALGIVLLFKNLNLKPSKFINQIAASTLGVYLIHDNYYMRGFIWGKVPVDSRCMESPLYFLGRTLVIVLIIFAACVIIDQIRMLLLEKPLMKVIQKE